MIWVISHICEVVTLVTLVTLTKAINFLIKRNKFLWNQMPYTFIKTYNLIEESQAINISEFRKFY